MPICAIFGCRSRSKSPSKPTNREQGVGMFSLPKLIIRHCGRAFRLSDECRRVWLARINRNDLENLDSIRVCGRHFITEKPSNLMDDSNPDWAPSQHLGYGADDRGVPERTERYARTKQRSRTAITITPSVPSTLSAAADTSTPMDLAPESEPTLPGCSLDEEPYRDVTDQTDLIMTELQSMQHCRWKMKG